MFKKIIYSVFFLASGVIIFAAVTAGDSQGFKDQLIKYIEANKEPEKKSEQNKAELIKQDENLTEEEIDKDKSSNLKVYLFKENDGQRRNSYFEIYGGIKQNFVYGKSYFTDKKYQTFDEDIAESKIISKGYTHSSNMNFHIEGHFGKRVTLYLDHSEDQTNNAYRMEYRAVEEDEFVREIRAGDIDIKQSRSKYAVFDSSGQKGIGLDALFKSGGLELRAFGCLIKGKTEVEYFNGNSSAAYISLSEYQYVRNAYFQLEPFKRYDGLNTAPVISLANNSYNSLITFSSAPANPGTFRAFSVNIDARGFQLYMDDQNPTNNANIIRLTAVDSGFYDRLTLGVDFRINYNTGQVVFLKSIPETARVFALYTLGGSTLSSDPAARTDLFPGKIFTFIKYGISINEDLNQDYLQDRDINNDGRINYDIYEIRSVYFLGQNKILPEKFSLKIYNERNLLTANEINSLGKYNLDYNNGLLIFYLREPFRPLLDQNAISIIYNEARSLNVYDHSKYKLRVDYYKDARNFNLKHSNIIPDSVSIKINGQKISTSFYTVNNQGGNIEFVNPNNPIIDQNTAIEIRYEYLPEGVTARTFSGGLRADYRLNEVFSAGSTFLFSRNSDLKVIPEPGEEPVQNMVFEADAEMYISPKNMGKIASLFSTKKVSKAPVDLRTYVEFARSYTKTNTFGKAMLDDMDSTNSIIAVSLSDKDWILSSLPQSGLQSDRARLNYYYYRDLSEVDKLLGDSFSGYAVDYAVKPGPFNLAEGHKTQIADDDEISLGFDFDFSYGNYASVVTRNLSDTPVDFYGLQYVEIWYRAVSGTGMVNFGLDLGIINEDSDGDNLLDTEDENYNGSLDYDPGKRIFEDRGFIFNPAGEAQTYVGGGPRLTTTTRGDGRLTSEDLNHNGVLDLDEQIISFPGARTYIPGNLPLETELQVDLADTTWKRARIYLRRSDLTDNEKDILKKVRAIRIYLQNISASTGRIYIDSIKMVSTNWKDIKINDVPLEDPDRLKIEIVDTYNDSEYNQNSFMSLESNLYLSLYGDKNRSDLNDEYEAALSLEYNLAGGENASLIRRFNKNMDLRYYKNINIWLNTRSITTRDRLRVHIGTTENDYYEYETTLFRSPGWQKVDLNLEGKSSSSAQYIDKTGFPDLKKIRIIKLVIMGSAGRFWVNNIYVSDPVTVKDNAYWCETEMNILRPFYKTASGVPIISDFNVKYVYRGYGANYNSPGRTIKDMEEISNEIYTSMQVIPNMQTDFEFKYIKNKTDMFNADLHESLTGRTDTKTFMWSTDYISVESGIPSFSLIYRQEDYQNNAGEYFNLSRIERETNKNKYLPRIMIEEEIDDFFNGKLVTELILDLSFERKEISRGAMEGSLTALESEEISLNEKESRQKSFLIFSTEYLHEYFFIRPVVDINANEFVKYTGKLNEEENEILEEVNGKHHFPFYYKDDNFKFIDRGKKVKFQWGLRNISIIEPEHFIEVKYLENTFKDYTAEQHSLQNNFSRSKTCNSNIEHKIIFPFVINSKSVYWLKRIEIGYRRNIAYNESFVPFEGEKINWYQEEYGVNNAWDGIGKTGVNFFVNPPWKFYRGRNNYANGRDRVYSIENNPIYYSNDELVTDYNNSLQLTDETSFSTNMDFNVCYLNWSNSFRQMSERQDLQGVPQQNVTLNSSLDFSLNLMEIFNFWFFRSNKSGLSHHASFFNLGYSYTRNMFVTMNICEQIHSPSAGITFKWNNSNIYIKGSIELRHKEDKEYIPLDDEMRSAEDDIYYDSLAQINLDENDRGYNFTTGYETDVRWLYNLFGNLYKLTAYPVFKISYDLVLNRYDYKDSVSPEPYDQHLVTTQLVMDLHQNVQGGLSGRWAFEKFRNRETEGVYREIKSYELGFSLNIHF